MKEVMIRIKGQQVTGEAGEDIMEFVTEAKIYSRGGALYLVYDESELSGIPGCRTRLKFKDGKLQRNAEARLIRDNVVVFEGKLSSLKRFKDDAKEVAEGYECGVSFDSFNDIKEGDVIECYVMEEVER